MNVPPPIAVRELIEHDSVQRLGLQVLAGQEGLDTRRISNPRIQKPGLALAGYLPYVKGGRVQILGESEHSYLDTLTPAEAANRLRALVELDVPVIISTKGLRPSQEILEHCAQRGVPILTSMEQTSDTIDVISAYLERKLAPWVQVHGVLMDVFSIGTLIVGDAGVGKSESALELIYRGHRLVADDVVVIRRTPPSGLIGKAHRNIKYFLELRGVGIIDIRKHFGMSATSPEIPISLMIRLCKLDQEGSDRDEAMRVRLLTEQSPYHEITKILGVPLPLYTMSVAPGRDVSLMVETAVRKSLLAERGVIDEQIFIERVNQRAMGLEVEEIEFD